MGKTIRKIGKQGAKQGIPVVEGTAYAEAHGIDIPFNCRCEWCMGEAKAKKARKLAEKEMKSEFWDFLDTHDDINPIQSNSKTGFGQNLLSIMKKFKLALGLILSTVLFFAVPSFGQLTVSALVGSSFVLNERTTPKMAPAVEARIGYEIAPSSVARINFFAGGAIRNFRAKGIIDDVTYTSSDFTTFAGAGFSLGDRVRLGLNGGIQASPDHRQETPNGKLVLANRAGFGEGTVSYFHGPSNSEGGISVKAETAFRATDHFKEAEVGKNTGVVMTSLFIRQGIGKRKVKTVAPTAITNNSGSFSTTRDMLLKDSIFGQALVGTMAIVAQQEAQQAASIAIDSSKRLMDLQLAQTHSKTMADVNKILGDFQRKVPTSYPNQPVGYKNVVPILYANKVFVLTAGQKETIASRVTGQPNSTKFVVTSFTSDLGTDAFNQKLVKQRADEVVNYLKTFGFSNFEIRLFPSQSAEDGNRSTLIQF